ncbi:MAG: Gfo/Idh/MocA family protein [Planctomycetota bacterium]|jgi:predicted dehydrogenase
MEHKPVGLGIIGCGSISNAYLEMCKNFKILNLKSCADIVMERAEAQGEKFGVQACTVDEMLADDEIEIVVNLTIPKAHAEVNLAAIEAGKNVHVEKPFAVTRDQAAKVLAAAEAKGVLTGAAPDTFLGAGIQTCRKLIAEGAIGRPIGATAFMMCHGHESWHPDPEFYYEAGGGPMFDMGPYYLTALVNLLGPIKQVTGVTGKAYETRTITSEKKSGKVVPVEVPTHVTGLMQFAEGAIGSIIMSFDVWTHRCPIIEIYGTEATLWVPDPNGFGGPVFVGTDWEGRDEVELTHTADPNGRGMGPADMAYALRTGRKHRATGELGNHVLDAMWAFHDAADAGKHVELTSTWN